MIILEFEIVKLNKINKTMIQIFNISVVSKIKINKSKTVQPKIKLTKNKK